MDNQSLFSIAIPTYNRLNLFKYTLQSARAQDYPNLEIIIFDNHSTDGTQEYSQEICAIDSRIRYIRYAENIGGIRTYERIAENIKGKYLLALSDDDCIDPDFCSTAVAHFEEFSNIVIWVCMIDLFFGQAEYNKQDSKNVIINNRYQGVLTGRDCIKKAFHSQVSLMFCATVYLVSAFKKAGGFCCGSYSLDLAATLSTASYGDVYLYPQVLSHVRVHKANTSNKLNEGQPLVEMDRMLKAYQQLENNAGDIFKSDFLYAWLVVAMAKIITFRDLRYLPSIYRLLRAEGYSLWRIVVNTTGQFPKMLLRIAFGSGVKLRLKRMFRKLRL